MTLLLKKFLMATLIFLMIAAVAIFWQVILGGVENGAGLKELRVGEGAFFIEIADTPIARAKGLSGREKLNNNEGMFFIFDVPSQYSFWMKDMKFPLDIIWIADDKVIGMVLGAEPESNEPLTIYTPPQPVDKVLEVNAGSVMRLGINIGDVIQL